MARPRGARLQYGLGGKRRRGEIGGEDEMVVVISDGDGGGFGEGRRW